MGNQVRLKRLGLGGLIGLLSAFLAVGVGEAIAVFVRPAAAPVIVVGNRIILATPESLKRWVIHRVGTNDKPVLLTSIYLGIAAFAVLVGILALYRLWLGLIGVGLFGAIGVYCALTTHEHHAGDIAPMLFGTAAGLAAMIALVRAVTGADRRPPGVVDGPLVADRRGFLKASAMAAGLAALGGFGGWAVLAKRYDVSKARAAVTLPAPASPAPALAIGTDLGKGAVPFSTALKGFYRIDTALAVPEINPATWQLNIHGRVDHPLRLTYADLLARPLIERWITLACVSNEVGGDLIGNTRFLGAPLADILREAGVHPDADQLVSRSSDGMTIGTPTAAVLDGRDAMLAVGMNGAPLPVEHGFPVRMVVPGLYGYVSACKWIVDIEATTFADDSAYWVQAGWIPKAPIQTSSRIDTPHSSAQLTMGTPVNVAGVAWRQHVGVAQVEVQVDTGQWAPARLAPVPSVDTWAQWVFPWTPTTPGLHTLRVRATDRQGAVQSGADAEPFPGASSGYHTISLNVHG